MYIVYEGMDKTGKGTLKRAVAEATNFKYIHIDRGPIGYMVYDEIYGRKSDESIKQFENDWNVLKNDVLVVYLTATYETIEKRIEKYNDPILDRDLLIKTNEMYDRLITKYCQNVPWVVVDTTVNSIKKCVQYIIDFIDEVQKHECNSSFGK